jgi:hypothetical protein
MKMNYFKSSLILVGILLLVFSGCNKESATEPDASFTIDRIDSLRAAKPVTVLFEGSGDFVSVYSGKKGQIWGDTSGAIGTGLTGESASLLYSSAGEYEVAVVATSYGNWSEEEIMDVKYQTITVLDDRKEFIKFSITKPKLSGEIIGADISFSFSDMVDVTALKPNWLLGSVESAVYIDGVEQVSKASIVDFTNPVIYTVVAGDGSFRNYTVTINTYPAASGTEITELGMEEPLIVADIDGNDITIYVPHGSELTALPIYAMASPSAIVENGTKEVKSSASDHDVSSQPTVLTVTAENEDTEDWNLYTIPEITFTEFKFSNLIPEVIGVLDSTGTSFNMTVLEGTDLETLVATFTLSVAGTAEIGSIPQESGVTVNSFASPRTYTLIMSDGHEVEYDVLVTSY